MLPLPPGVRLVRALRRVVVAVVALLAVVMLSGGASASGRQGGAAPTRTAAQGEGAGDGAVEILQLTGTLDPPVVAAIADLVRAADARGSLLVVLQIDAPGSVAVHPATVAAAVQSTRVPVVVWVGPRAARADGAAQELVRVADVAAMSSDATVAGVDAAAAEAAGDVDLVAEALEPLLVDLDGYEVDVGGRATTLRVREDEVTVRFHSLGLLRRVLHAALSPAFVYLLLMAALLLFSFELFQPGFGVAGIAGLLVAPLAIYGIVVLPARWWALALVVVGVVLLAYDLAVAGLGLPTAAGTVALAAGSWWLFAGDDPLLKLSAWIIAFVVVLALVFFVIVMTTVLRAQAGPPDVAAAAAALVGRPGVVRSTLNPEGHVFADGALWRARWVGAATGRVRTGTHVTITGVDEQILLVEAGDQEPAGAVEPGITDAAQPPQGASGGQAAHL
ncbi:MAG TPA: NfeD family protein [Solirubrobacteraceae bacterium]|nr:NfeD family protein [Solirubrobacteraceae bacterium]